MTIEVYSLSWLSRIHNKLQEIIFIKNVNVKECIDPEIIIKRYINDNFKGSNRIVGETKKTFELKGTFNINRDFFFEEVEKLFPNKQGIQLMEEHDFWSS